MKKLIAVCFAILLSACNSQQNQESLIPQPSHLLVEGKDQPLNVHNSQPKLSWHAKKPIPRSSSGKPKQPV
ncbi:hypothetical protein [Pseudoalteromonas marina]|uniref:hypothetical protein n=1 Tax=Pseudoalteromonas marina TaxID=267375 RepID=UPI0023F00293|nr:hypothetical protein [Pseudoalteromonas marina]